MLQDYLIPTPTQKAELAIEDDIDGDEGLFFWKMITRICPRAQTDLFFECA